ncbi:hypothetical protein ACTNEO_12425 [Gracilibacillus sp. HCP3S3_G5_1]|uniref:hypothetical protein n=1 Tax=unclassified Gracilibacillus TaxID=2625209 RepID=UPI003F8CDB92
MAEKRWPSLDARIKQLIDLAQTKFGLDNYWLKRHSIDRSLNIFNETEYKLSMEWFPEHISVNEEDDLNPEGTAVMEVDLHNQQFNSIVFVGGKTYADKGVRFDDCNTNSIIDWIENETGLKYERHFQLKKEAENILELEECINGTPVSPAGFISVEWDHKGRLTLFSVHGYFPPLTIVREEKYELSLQEVEEIVKEQLKLVYFPSFEKEKLNPVYAVEEIYISNDKMGTIPFFRQDDRGPFLKVNQVLDWQKPLDESFEREEFDLDENPTLEQAFSREPSPDSIPISPDEEKECVQAVKTYLRKAYADDAGKWLLKTLHREKGYIVATLKLKEATKLVFPRKLVLFIDPNRKQVVNFIDNRDMLEMFDAFEKPEEVRISKEEAYHKLKEKFRLMPRYVYDFEEMQYILCGGLDCDDAVHAISGEVVSLNE